MIHASTDDAFNSFTRSYPILSIYLFINFCFTILQDPPYSFNFTTLLLFLMN